MVRSAVSARCYFPAPVAPYLWLQAIEVRSVHWMLCAGTAAAVFSLWTVKDKGEPV